MTILNQRLVAVFVLLLAAGLVSPAVRARPRPRLIIVSSPLFSDHGWRTQRSLEDTLQRWCRRTHSRLVWRPRHDYRLEAQATFHGSFVHALGVLARSLALAHVPLALRYYRGNRVLVVKRWAP